MKKFEFRLQRVLEWRERKLEVELAKQQRIAADLRLVVREMSEIQTALGQSYPPDPTGAELAALQSYFDRLHRDFVRLEQRRMEMNAALTKQKAVVLSSDRDVKVIERLKERAHEEWRLASDKEVEELAGENAINRWGRA